MNQYYRFDPTDDPEIIDFVRGWCIDRTSLEVRSFRRVVECQSLLLRSYRVGQVVSESEFKLKIQSHAESVKTESMMRQINEQKQFQDRLNERKI